MWRGLLDSQELHTSLISHPSLSFQNTFFRRWSRDITTLSKFSLLKINIAFRMSVIPIWVHPEVSFKWWPKLLLWTMWQESTLKTSWGTSIVKSPFHGLARFVLDHSLHNILTWIFFKVRNTIPWLCKSCCASRFRVVVYFLSIAVIAASTSE